MWLDMFGVLPPAKVTGVKPNGARSLPRSKSSIIDDGTEMTTEMLPTLAQSSAVTYYRVLEDPARYLEHGPNVPKLPRIDTKPLSACAIVAIIFARE
jgi:hypothetical protein